MRGELSAFDPVVGLEAKGPVSCLQGVWESRRLFGNIGSFQILFYLKKKIVLNINSKPKLSADVALLTQIS